MKFNFSMIFMRLTHSVYVFALIFEALGSANQKAARETRHESMHRVKVKFGCTHHMTTMCNLSLFNQKLF